METRMKTLLSLAALAFALAAPLPAAAADTDASRIAVAHEMIAA